MKPAKYSHSETSHWEARSLPLDSKTFIGLAGRKELEKGKEESLRNDLVQSSDGETEAQRGDGSVSRSQNKPGVEIRLEESFLTSDTAPSTALTSCCCYSTVLDCFSGCVLFTFINHLPN